MLACHVTVSLLAIATFIRPIVRDYFCGMISKVGMSWHAGVQSLLGILRGLVHAGTVDRVKEAEG